MSSNEQTNSDKYNDFANHIRANADRYISILGERFGTLDFSLASLTIVEDALDIAFDFYEDMPEAKREDLIECAGSYIFEVARQNFGGRYFWYNKLNQPILVTGQPEFEMSLLAFEKVKGRLTNGAEDAIPFFFEGFVDGVKQKRSAMIV